MSRMIITLMNKKMLNMNSTSIIAKRSYVQSSVVRGASKDDAHHDDDHHAHPVSCRQFYVNVS